MKAKSDATNVNETMEIIAVADDPSDTNASDDSESDTEQEEPAAVSIDTAEADSSSKSDNVGQLKLDKTKLVGPGARESMLTSGIKSTKDSLFQAPANKSGTDTETPLSTGTSNFNSVNPTPSKGTQSSDNSLSSSLQTSEESSAPAKKELFPGRSFLNSLKASKQKVSDREQQPDEGVVGSAGVSTVGIADAQTPNPLKGDSPKQSSSVDKQVRDGNAVAPSLKTPKAPLFARSYVNSLKNQVQKASDDEGQSTSKVGDSRTSFPSSKTILKGTTPSLKANAAGGDFSQKVTGPTAKKLGGSVLPVTKASFATVGKASSSFPGGLPFVMKGKESVSNNLSTNKLSSLQEVKGIVKAKAGFGIAASKMKIGGPFAINGALGANTNGESSDSASTSVESSVAETSALKLPAVEASKTNLMSGLKGSGSMLKSKAIFGVVGGLKMTTGGPKQPAAPGFKESASVSEGQTKLGVGGLKNVFATKQPVGIISGSKGSDSVSKLGNLKMKIGAPPPMKGFVAKQPALGQKFASNADPGISKTGDGPVTPLSIKGFPSKQGSDKSPVLKGGNAVLKGDSSNKFTPQELFGSNGRNTMKTTTLAEKSFIEEQSASSDARFSLSSPPNGETVPASTLSTIFTQTNIEDSPTVGENGDEDLIDKMGRLESASAFVSDQSEGNDAFGEDYSAVEATDPVTFVSNTISEPSSSEGEDITSLDELILSESAKDAEEEFATNERKVPDSLSRILENIDFTLLPLLHVGDRMHSSAAGAAHRGYLVLQNDEDESRYNVLPCTAKRPWTMSEIKANVVSEITTGTVREDPLEDWEAEFYAKSVRDYFEVEYHCYQKIDNVKQLRKLRIQQAEADKESKAQTNMDAAADTFDVFDVAVPKLLGIYEDGGNNDSSSFQTTSSVDEDVWGKSLDNSLEWMVYTGGGSHGIESALSQHVAVNPGDPHHLYGVQKALNLPEWFKFGDVMDVVFRSLLENLVFLTSCNIVHRNSK